MIKTIEMDTDSPYTDKLLADLIRSSRAFAQARKLAAQREEEAKERERLESLPPKYVIHTVHGTWARRAHWILEDSFLGWNLRKDLAWRAKIEPFVWSKHGNNVEARLNASRRFKSSLQLHIDRYRQEYKAYCEKHDDYSDEEPKHLVVAHSHGGNIAFMALDEHIADKVFGVITLGTPFLQAKLRPAGDNLIDLGTGLLISLFALWAFLFYGHYRGLGWGLWPWALAAVPLTALVLSGGAWTITKMQQHAAQLVGKMPQSALKPEQVAIIRVQGDEALVAMAGARVAGRCVDLLWAATGAKAFGFVERLLNFVDYGNMRSLAEQFDSLVRKGDDRPNFAEQQAAEKRKQKEAIGQVVWNGLAIALILAFQSGTPEDQWWAALVAGVFALPAALAILIVVLAIPFALLSSLSLWPCGRSMPFAGTYLHVAVEASPQGTWNVTQYDAGERGSPLLHSRAYNDQRVPPFIVNWIEDREAAVRNTHEKINYVEFPAKDYSGS